MGEVLSTAQARAAGLGRKYPDTVDGNAALDERIVAEEKRLRGRIGPLTGARTQRIAGPHVWINRAVLAGSLSIVDSAGGTIAADTYRLEPNGQVVTVAGDLWQSGPVMTWTPDDLELVRSVLIDLLRITLTETGFEGETIRGYSYRRGSSGTRPGTAQQRDAAIAPLLAHGGLGV